MGTERGAEKAPSDARWGVSQIVPPAVDISSNPMMMYKKNEQLCAARMSAR